MQLGEHILENGRKYQLTDHGEFKPGEYPTGGIHISTWDERINQGEGGWLYVDNAPDLECAGNFLNAAKRLAPVSPLIPGMSKVTLCIQEFGAPNYRKNYTPNWDLVRKEALTFFTKRKGEAAASEAFHITNCPSLTDKELAKLKTYNGPALSVGDVVKVENEEGTQEFLCDSIGWQER